MNELHLYAQGAWHEEAFIVGEEAALIELRDAINKALETGRGHCMPMQNDGEGYHLLIAKIDSERMDKMANAYTDDIAAEQNRIRHGERFWPLDLPEIKEAYREADDELKAKYAKPAE